MARKIAVACVWLGLLSPVGVNALGLGDIHVRSALNQPLDAEVELISATSVELDELEISLAPRETFERYGLDRPTFLSGLQFDVTRSANGEPMLHVTTDRPVSEPFLTFLIEAQWPRGRLLREYTVLLDPPVYLSDDAARTPVREESGSRSEPDASVAGPITRRSEAASRANSPPPSFRSGEYAVERNDTLWTIADRLRAGSDATVNQMMIALYRANPEAFGGNINLLLAGAVLRVPDASTIDALATGEADSEVARQNSLWPADSGPLTAGAGNADSAGARLRLVPPSDESIAGAGDGAGGSSAESSAAAVDGDEESLRREVSELRSQLEEAERLVELKDSELAALQGRLAELEAGAAGADEIAPTGRASPGVDLETETTAAEEATVAEEEAAAPAPTTAAAPPRATIGDSGGIGDTLAGIFGSMWLYVGLGIALLLGAMLVFAQRRRAPAEITGRWQSFDESDDEQAPAPRIGATQTLRALPDTGESIVVVEQKPAATIRREAPAAARAKVRETRPEPAAADDDDTLSGATAVHLDQADPLAEADFHMAYGLYDQAADLVRKASREEPGRRDLRMKLLEIYFVWGNEQAFLDEAQQLHDSIGGRPDADWDKILIMGKQICPDEALFAGEPGAGGAESGDVDLELAGDATGDSTVDFVTEGGGDEALDLDLGDTTQADETGRTRAHGGDADVLDFDFDEEQPEEPDLTREEGSTIEASGFESPTIETPTLEQPGPESPTVESPTLESARYEDSTVETPTIEQRIGAVRGAGGSDQTAEIDLDDLGLDLENLRDDDSLEGTLGDAAETMLADMSGFDEPRETGQPDSDEFDATLTTPAGTAGRGGFGETAAARAGGRDFDATSELALPDGDALDIDLEDLSAALESSDTVEQPRPASGGDTVRQRRTASDDTQQLTAAGEEFLDMDLTEMLGDDADSVGSAGAADFDLDDLDETESEVGTKLDLARAYMDMGDPEGANSILQEVLEEGDDSQRDEAQRLLNALP